MTQRDLILDKYLGPSIPEEARDEMHDAMKEHAIEFKDWCGENEHQFRLDNIYENNKNITTEQLYNKFNLNK